MRIGINAYFLAHPHTGSGVYLTQLVATMQHIPGLDLCLYSPPAAIPPELNGIPVRIISIPPTMPRQWRKLFFEAIAFPLLALKEGCDLLHAPYFAVPLFGTDATVVTVHDVIPLLLREYSSGLLASTYSVLMVRLVRACTRVIADSAWTKRDLVQTTGSHPERVNVVHLAAEPDLAPVMDRGKLLAVRKKYDLPEHFILYFGGFDRRKKVDTLLNAYRLLIQRDVSMPDLVLAGGFLPERASRAVLDPRALLADDSLKTRVHLIGAVTKEEKAILYSSAELFVFPSAYEGFGLPPLEAMACGLPVIATNASSLPEVCGDAALMVPPGDAYSLAGAMRVLARDRNMQIDFSKRSLARARCFSWDKTAEKTSAVYAEALRRSKSRGRPSPGS